MEVATLENFALVFVLGWVVNYLLIMGVCQLYSCVYSHFRLVIAAAVCAFYGLLILQDWVHAELRPYVGVGVIVLASFIGFGCKYKSFRYCGTFLLLRIAVAGVLDPLSILRPWPLLLASFLLLVVSVLGFPVSNGDLIPIELYFGTNHIALTGLRDTGNTLHDPVTGRPVLILSSDVAQNLTGLTPNQLRNPVDTMGAIPGLRLIPYRTIAGEGMLLALHLPRVCIGGHCRSELVAFAPEVLSREGRFQALTGGVL
jgi:stage II sporulation protein GA (sporulation sigma-E factor processing peptidase)